MKKLIYLLCVAVFFCSCNKSVENVDEDQNTDEIKFEQRSLPSQVSDIDSLQKILDGYIIKAIDFDSKGNAWIGTFNQGIIRYNAEETVFYTFDNGFIIWDIAVDKNDNVWVGCGNGLLKYDGQEFILYNSQNTAMPEDIVWKIVVDSKNNIWFASCRAYSGGLVKYDGTKWTAYTPNNSALPDNLINDIAIDQSDNIWLTVNNYLVKVTDDKWKIYDKNDLELTNFIFAGIQFNSKNLLLGITDHSFNGFAIQPPCELYNFDGKKSTLLSKIDNLTSIPGQTKITIDSNDYIWCYGVIGGICGVWVGDQWKQLDLSKFGGSSVWAMKEASDYKMWFGTDNGIYIR